MITKQLLTSAILFLVTVAPQAAVAQTAAEDEKKLLDAWMEMYFERASQYEIVFNDDTGKTLKLKKQPLLQYTNPVRQREQHGAVFVWTVDGRPQAIGTIWSMLHQRDPTIRKIAHEFHSLSEKPLIANRPASLPNRLNPLRDLAPWSPNHAGVKFELWQDAPPVAMTPAARLSQMRRLAATCEAHAIDRNDGSKINLRRMPAPLMRYASPENDLLDGAMFSFVLATDPELFLLIETRKGKDGIEKWHFAVARFTGLALRLERGGREVWKCDQIVAGPTDRVYDLQFNVNSVRSDYPLDTNGDTKDDAETKPK